MSAGKGDSPRRVDGNKYRDGYDRIFRKGLQLPCYLCGKLTDGKGHCARCKITTALDSQPLRVNLADYENPVWDGPPRKEPPMKVNQEGDE
jgi:hypothetical protein